MSPLLIALILSVLLPAALLVVIAFLLVKNNRKNKIMRAAAKRSLNVRKTLKRREKSLERVFRIFNDFIVQEVQAGADEQLDKVMSALTAQEVRNVRRTTIMGITRLFVEKGRPKPPFAYSVSTFSQSAAINIFISWNPSWS